MIDTIWQEFLKIVSEEIGSRAVDTWFKSVSIYQWDSIQKAVYLKTPNKFVKNWLENNYINLFKEHLPRLLNVNFLKVIFLNTDEDKHEEKNFTPAVIQKTKTKKKNFFLQESSKVYGHINPNYRFDNFIVGTHNSLACAAAKAVTEKLGTLYNPLFIYGGSGLGKTHLLQAMANEIKQKKENILIVYQTADRFVNEFINAIRLDKVHRFKAKYHNIDVLLIDDIQFISNKEQTQEAFFHIFNILYESRKQIVFSSDTFPQDIKGLAVRLRSRLQGGLITDIYMPSLETKIAILKKKALSNNENLPDEVAHLIASQSYTSIRELEGALVRVLAFSSLTQQNLTLELAEKVLTRAKKVNTCKKFDLDVIAKQVSKFYSFTIEELKSDSRNKDVALARQITMFFMKKLTNKSLREIGTFLNRKDHTTVLYALGKIKSASKSNQDFNNILGKIEKAILD